MMMRMMRSDGVLRSLTTRIARKRRVVTPMKHGVPRRAKETAETEMEEDADDADDDDDDDDEEEAFREGGA